jgi:hypothetical protein
MFGAIFPNVPIGTIWHLSLDTVNTIEESESMYTVQRRPTTLATAIVTGVFILIGGSGIGVWVIGMGYQERDLLVHPGKETVAFEFIRR